MSAETPTLRRWFDWRIVPLLAVTGVVIWALIEWLAGADAFFEAVATARWQLLPAAIGLVGVNLLLAAIRWRIILTAMGYTVSLRRALGAVLATWPLALIIPARAGDVLRALALRDSVPPWETAGSVIVEKAVDAQSLCLLAVLGTLVHGFYEWTAIAFCLLVAEWTFVLLILRRRETMLSLPVIRRAAGKVRQLVTALEALARQPRALGAVVATSVGAWLMSSGVVQTLLTATGSRVGFGTTVSLWPIAIFAGMLPLTVAGMGTRDAMFVYAVGTTTATLREEAVIASTLGYSLVATWLLGVVGLPFSIRFALRVGRTQPQGATDG